MEGRAPLVRESSKTVRKTRILSTVRKHATLEEPRLQAAWAILAGAPTQRLLKRDRLKAELHPYSA